MAIVEMRKGDDDARRRLSDPAAVGDRVAALNTPHMRALNDLVGDLRKLRQVPWFDPFDGGDRARLLILLQSPARRGTDPRFVSRDNPTPTQANLRGFLAEAGIARRDTVLWNLVPWVLDPDLSRNRAPTRTEIAEGLQSLSCLLPLLGRFRVVLAAGRVAARSAPVVAGARPDAAFFEMPHPSPVHVNTSPDIAARIRTILGDVSRTLTR